MQEAPEASAPVSEDAAPSCEFVQLGFDVEQRLIWIGDIDENAGERFIKALMVLMKHNDFPIHIIMNSSGGSWTEAKAIYDAICDCDTEISIEVYGCCMSAAPVIVQACEVRWIHPNADVMVHDGTHGGESDTRTFVSWGKHAEFQRKRYFEMLAQRSTKRPAFWKRKCVESGDFFMTADQAVKFGLFDYVTRDL